MCHNRFLVIKDPYDQARFDWFCKMFKTMRGIVVLRHPLRVSVNRPGSALMRFQAWILAMYEAVLADYECPVMFIRYEDLVTYLSGKDHDIIWRRLLSFVGDNSTRHKSLERPYVSNCRKDLPRKRDFYGNRTATKVHLMCDREHAIDQWFLQSKRARDLASVLNRHQRSLLQQFGYSLQPPLIRACPKAFLVNSMQTKTWLNVAI